MYQNAVKSVFLDTAKFGEKMLILAELKGCDT